MKLGKIQDTLLKDQSQGTKTKIKLEGALGDKPRNNKAKEQYLEDALFVQNHKINNNSK